MLMSVATRNRLNGFIQKTPEEDICLIEFYLKLTAQRLNVYWLPMGFRWLNFAVPILRLNSRSTICIFMLCAVRCGMARPAISSRLVSSFTAIAYTSKEDVS
jgi:hypothetical protein